MIIAQAVAVVIFVAMFVLIVLDKIERHYVTLGCGLLTLVLVFGLLMRSWAAISYTLNLKSLFTQAFWFQAGAESETSGGINWMTIIFIAGMMIMVEGMADTGFFRWLCMRIAKLVHYKIIPVFITFMLMSAVLSMFIDSITVILFLAAVTVELAQLLKFNPVPMILAEIFCANLGGAATMCGDPPNIIIGTSFGYSFSDFLTNTGAMVGISLIVIVLYFYFCFRGQFKARNQAEGEQIYPDPKSAIVNKKSFALSCVIFALAVVLLVSHAATGLTVATIGVLIAAFTLLAAGKKALYLLKKLDVKTLLFFVGLFVVVGGLEQTGILEIIASFIGRISNGNSLVMVAIILWTSAIASAFIDNIPFAATMIPVIRALAETQGVPLEVLTWTLSMGTDIGGSATPIGASANVVGTSVASREGYPIGWGRYCRVMAPATVIVLVISMAYIVVVYL
ncbi:MAG: SLC13 family permease [Clostridia bacterium]